MFVTTRFIGTLYVDRRILRVGVCGRSTCPIGAADQGRCVRTEIAHEHVLMAVGFVWRWAGRAVPYRKRQARVLPRGPLEPRIGTSVGRP